MVRIAGPLVLLRDRQQLTQRDGVRRGRRELRSGLNYLVADDTDAAETARINSSLKKEYKVLLCALCALLLSA